MNEIKAIINGIFEEQWSEMLDNWNEDWDDSVLAMDEDEPEYVLA